MRLGYFPRHSTWAGAGGRSVLAGVTGKQPPPPPPIPLSLLHHCDLGRATATAAQRRAPVRCDGTLSLPAGDWPFPPPCRPSYLPSTDSDHQRKRSARIFSRRTMEEWKGEIGSETQFRDDSLGSPFFSSQWAHSPWPPWGSTACAADDVAPGGTLPPSMPPAAAWRRPTALFPGRRPTLFASCGDGTGDAGTMGEVRVLAEPEKLVARGGLVAAFARSLSTLELVGDSIRNVWIPSGHISPWEYTPKVLRRKMYAVRLFFFGCWRRVVVDDTIPVDAQGNILLPGGNPPSMLWPYVLFKALSVLASLSWTPTDDTHDFSVMECLMGGICETVPLAVGSPETKWKTVRDYLVQFGRYRDDTEQDLNSASELKCNYRSTFSRRDSTKTLSDAFNVDESFIVAVLKNKNGHVHHVVLLEGRRLDTEYTSILEHWRKVRWVEWARRHNVPFFENKEYCVLKIEGIFSDGDRHMDKSHSLYSTSSDYFPKSRSDFNLDLISRLSEAEKCCKIAETINSTWVTIDDVAPMLKCLEVYRKPSSFSYTSTVTDMPIQWFFRVKSADASMFTKQEHEGFYSYRNEVQSEPLFVFVDSECPKSVLFHLNVMPEKAQVKEETAEAVNPSEASQGSVLLEQFHWWDSSGRALGVVRTSGRAVGRVRLGEGRFVLRLWLAMRACSGFVLRCLSDGRETFLASRDDVLKRMGKDSVRVLTFGSSVRAAFTTMAMHFGRPECHEAARTFRQMLSTATNDDFQALSMFLESAAATVSSCAVRPGTPRKDDLRYALNLAFSSPKKSTSAASRSGRGEKGDRSSAREDSAARVLQAFFRRVAQRAEAERQREGRESSPRRPRRALRRLADVMAEPEALWHVLGDRALAAMLRFSRDFLFTVRLREWNTPGAAGGPWGAVFRAELRARGPSRVAVSVSCDALPHDRLVVRLVDNDAPAQERDEAHPQGVQPAPRVLPPNARAYTLFVHVPDIADFSRIGRSLWLWRLRLCTPRPGDELISARVTNLVFSAVHEPYIPCQSGLIGRCLLRTRQNAAVVSLRFAVSGAFAHFELRLTNEEGTVLVEARGVGSLVLPVVVLETQQDSVEEDTEARPLRARVYTVEVHLVGDSWPLTDEEWRHAEAVMLSAPKGRRSCFRLGVDGRVTRHSRIRLNNSRISMNIVPTTPRRASRGASRRSPNALPCSRSPSTLAASRSPSTRGLSRSPSVLDRIPSQTTTGASRPDSRNLSTVNKRRPVSHQSPSVGSVSTGGSVGLETGCGSTTSGLMRRRSRHKGVGSPVQTQLPSPWWRLQLAAEVNDRVELALDCSTREKANRMQEELEREQPGRTERARAARATFLEKLRCWGEVEEDVYATEGVATMRPPPGNQFDLTVRARQLRSRLMAACLLTPNFEVPRLWGPSRPPRRSPPPPPPPPTRRSFTRPVLVARPRRSNTSIKSRDALPSRHSVRKKKKHQKLL